MFFVLSRCFIACCESCRSKKEMKAAFLLLKISSTDFGKVLRLEKSLFEVCWTQPYQCNCLAFPLSSMDLSHSRNGITEQRLCRFNVIQLLLFVCAGEFQTCFKFQLVLQLLNAQTLFWIIFFSFTTAFKLHF